MLDSLYSGVVPLKNGRPTTEEDRTLPVYEVIIKLIFEANNPSDAQEVGQFVVDTLKEDWTPRTAEVASVNEVGPSENT